MKSKILKSTALILAFLILSSQSLFAVGTRVDNSSDFEFDANEFSNEFENLDKLESVVLERSITTLDQLSAIENLELNMIKISTSLNNTSEFSFSNFDWPSGLWGFLCCPIGFFVVVTNKDKSKDQKISFWIGVAAGAVLNALTAPFYYKAY